MLTRTFHQGPGPGLGCQGPGQGLHSQGPGQGPWFEYDDKDKDLSKCGHIASHLVFNDLIMSKITEQCLPAEETDGSCRLEFS